MNCDRNSVTSWWRWMYWYMQTYWRTVPIFRHWGFHLSLAIELFHSIVLRYICYDCRGEWPNSSNCSFCSTHAGSLVKKNLQDTDLLVQPFQWACKVSLALLYFGDSINLVDFNTKPFKCLIMLAASSGKHVTVWHLSNRLSIRLPVSPSANCPWLTLSADISAWQ